MHMHKLFRILVLGGGVAGATSGCATNQPKPTPAATPAQASDAGPTSAAPAPTAPPAAPASGGGVTGW